MKSDRCVGPSESVRFWERRNVVGERLYTRTGRASGAPNIDRVASSSCERAVNEAEIEARSSSTDRDRDRRIMGSRIVGTRGRSVGAGRGSGHRDRAGTNAGPMRDRGSSRWQSGGGGTGAGARTPAHGPAAYGRTRARGDRKWHERLTDGDGRRASPMRGAAIAHRADRIRWSHCDASVSRCGASRRLATRARVSVLDRGAILQRRRAAVSGSARAGRGPSDPRRGSALLRG
jgi:hypothetical protein